MFTLPPATVAAITGLLLPIVVALVTKSHAPARLKVVVNVVASALVCLITNAVNDAGYAVVSGEMVGVWAQQTAISVATYLGIWKPLDVPQRLLPGHGLGR